MQAHCLGCHHVGGTGPFALDSYEAVAGRAATIRRVLQDGFMPPWFAAPGSGPWTNDPSLSAWERRTLFRWLDTGMPRGRSRRLAPLTAQVRERLDDRHAGPGSGAAEAAAGACRGFPPLPFRRDGPGFSRRPVGAGGGDPAGRAGQRPPRHRVPRAPRTGARSRPCSTGWSRSGPARARCARSSPTSPSTARARAAASSRHGTAKRLPANTRLLFQLHYVATGVPAVDRTQLGIVFAKEPPRHELHTASAFNHDFVIPAGAPNHEV